MNTRPFVVSTTMGHSHVTAPFRLAVEPESSGGAFRGGENIVCLFA